MLKIFSDNKPQKSNKSWRKYTRHFSNNKWNNTTAYITHETPMKHWRLSSRYQCSVYRFRQKIITLNEEQSHFISSGDDANQLKLSVHEITGIRMNCIHRSVGITTNLLPIVTSSYLLLKLLSKLALIWKSIGRVEVMLWTYTNLECYTEDYHTVVDSCACWATYVDIN